MFSDYIGIASELSFSRLYSKYAFAIVFRRSLCLFDCQFWLKWLLPVLFSLDTYALVFTELSSTTILEFQNGVISAHEAELWNYK